MNYKHILKIIGLSLLIISMFYVWAFAAEDIIEINSVEVIQSSDYSEIHLLAKPDYDFSDTTVIVKKAYLNANIEPNTQDTVTFISVRFYAITTDWTAGGVDWDYPWTEPGGDYDEMSHGEILITAVEEQEIQIDITDIVMRWFDGRLPYYGFLVSVSKSSRDQFNLVRSHPSDPYATITISY